MSKLLYHSIFSKGTALRTRIDTIISTGVDPAPETESFEPLEKMIDALAKGKENPFVYVNRLGNRDYDDKLLPITTRVFLALDELFLERDKGMFKVADYKDHLDVEFTEDCVALVSNSGVRVLNQFEKGQVIRSTHIKVTDGVAHITTGNFSYIQVRKEYITWS